LGDMFPGLCKPPTLSVPWAPFHRLSGRRLTYQGLTGNVESGAPA
jgi:hypothetical protein